MANTHATPTCTGTKANGDPCESNKLAQEDPPRCHWHTGDHAAHMSNVKAEFVRLIGEEGYGITKAARAVRTHHTTLYAWRELDPEFKAAWIEADRAFDDDIEQGFKLRLRDGVTEEIFQGGRKVGERTVHDHKGAQWYLACKRPELYGNKTLTELKVTTETDAAFDAALEDEAAFTALMAIVNGASAED